MTAHGRTVRIYLADGSPTGIRHAEVVNWTGQAIVCPRARIGELAGWPQAQRPGIYLLLGEDPEFSRPMAYIGEAENVLTRLKQHVVKKEFWDQVVFFSSKDDNLTKVHVKYLESRIVELATVARRRALENGTAPQPPSLPVSDQSAMEEFLDTARALLGTLGILLLEPVSRQNREIAPRTEAEAVASNNRAGALSSTPLYYRLPRFGVEATGYIADEGFVVATGSIGSSSVWPSLSAEHTKLRSDLIANGSIEEAGVHLRFTRDVLLASPAVACRVISGAGSGSRASWENQDGATLRDLENNLAGIAPEGASQPSNEESAQPVG